MRKCVLCKALVPQLAKSHVYPRALHLLFADDEEDIPPIMISRHAKYPGQVAQKSRAGVYGEFVCPDCERDLFGPADDAFMRLHHEISSWPLPGKEIEMMVQVVPGDPDLVHRFALQTLWRWAASPRSFTDKVDVVGLGPIIERIRSWLLNPAGTLWTDHDVAVSYRIADDNGFAMPPYGGWRAGSIFITVGNFTFIIASRSRGLSGPWRANRLRSENGVRLLATTQMRSWLIEPMIEMLGEGRMQIIDEFIDRMKAYGAARKS